MGYVGAALASSISTWLQFLLLVVYIRFFKVGRSACARIFARSIKPVDTSGVRVCAADIAS